MIGEKEQTMNKQLLEDALALLLKSNSFDMSTVVRDRDRAKPGCGTPGCIAGHIIAASKSADSDGLIAAYGPSAMCEEAGALAEIRPADGDRLFMPIFEPGGWHHSAKPHERGHITREHAARCLRAFIDTEIVDWDGTAWRRGRTT